MEGKDRTGGGEEAAGQDCGAAAEEGERRTWVIYWALKQGSLLESKRNCRHLRSKQASGVPCLRFVIWLFCSSVWSDEQRRGGVRGVY